MARPATAPPATGCRPTAPGTRRRSMEPPAMGRRPTVPVMGHRPTAPPVTGPRGLTAPPAPTLALADWMVWATVPPRHTAVTGHPATVPTTRSPATAMALGAARFMARR